VVIQVQGKKRGTIQVPTPLLEDGARVTELALESGLLERYAGGKAHRKTIVANGNKLVNFVLAKK
jgi:hypothetical protein